MSVQTQMLLTEDDLKKMMQEAIAEWQPTNADYVNMVSHFDERISHLEGLIRPLVAQLKETNRMLRKVLEAKVK